MSKKSYPIIYQRVELACGEPDWYCYELDNSQGGLYTQTIVKAPGDIVQAANQHYLRENLSQSELPDNQIIGFVKSCFGGVKAVKIVLNEASQTTYSLEPVSKPLSKLCCLFNIKNKRKASSGSISIQGRPFLKSP